MLGRRERGGGWAPGSRVPLRAPLLALHTPLWWLGQAELGDLERSGEIERPVEGLEEGRAARRVGRLSRDGARWGDPACSAPGFGDILG